MPIKQDQVKQLLLDEWVESCSVFSGDPDLLCHLAKPPFNFGLPRLLDVAMKSWWAWDVSKTPGMRVIAEYVKASWND